MQIGTAFSKHYWALLMLNKLFSQCISSCGVCSNKHMKFRYLYVAYLAVLFVCLFVFEVGERSEYLHTHQDNKKIITKMVV